MTTLYCRCYPVERHVEPDGPTVIHHFTDPETGKYTTHCLQCGERIGRGDTLLSAPSKLDEPTDNDSLFFLLSAAMLARYTLGKMDERVSKAEMLRSARYAIRVLDEAIEGTRITEQ